MHMKWVFTLLVVLALGSLLVAGAANSAIRTEGPSGSSQVHSSITYRDGDGELGGDDDRWGNATPGEPEEIPDPETPGEAGDAGDDADGQTEKQFVALNELWSMRMRMILSWMFRIL
jgi:hypothetical protein